MNVKVNFKEKSDRKKLRWHRRNPQIVNDKILARVRNGSSVWRGRKFSRSDFFSFFFGLFRLNEFNRKSKQKFVQINLWLLLVVTVKLRQWSCKNTYTEKKTISIIREM